MLIKTLIASISLCVCAVCLTLCPVSAYAQSADMDELIQALSSDDDAERMAAVDRAGLQGAVAVRPVGELLKTPDTTAAKAAAYALDAIVAYVGRPEAAPEEALAVADELVSLLSPEWPIQARRDVLHWLSLVGDGSIADVLAALLMDPDIGEDARLALERIPNEETVIALMDVAESLPASLRRRVIQTLGQKGGEEVAEALQFAPWATQSTAWARVDALSQMGVSPQTVMTPTTDMPPEQYLRFIRALLRAADVLQEQGNKDAAFALYRMADQVPGADYIQAAVLAGLSRINHERMPVLAFHLMRIPRFRVMAEKTLVQSTMPGLDEYLLMAYEQHSGSARTEVLRILVARAHPEAAGLLEVAQHDEDALLRLNAAILSDSITPNKDDFAPAMRMAPQYEQDMIARWAIEYAWILADSHADSAAELFELVAKESMQPDALAEAFRGLAVTAGEAQIPFFTEILGLPYNPEQAARFSRNAARIQDVFRDSDEVHHAADAAYISTMARLTDKVKAVESLQEMVARTSYTGTVVHALHTLHGLGEDAEALARSRGFLTPWQVLGPFPRPEEIPLLTPFMDETRPPYPDTVTFHGQDFVWVNVQGVNRWGFVDLVQALGPHTHAVAYAQMTLHLDEPMRLTFYVGSDDGCGLWVDGRLVIAHPSDRPFTADENRVDLSLDAGPHVLLLKVLQGGGDWSFLVRVTDADGNPPAVRQE